MSNVQETEADCKWKEAFANTTEEEFERLEKMLMEEEKYELMPLDFTGRCSRTGNCASATPVASKIEPERDTSGPQQRIAPSESPLQRRF